MAWFYRLLRNAVIDRYRRSGTEARLFPAEPDEHTAAYEPEIRGEICACIRPLLPALKPEHAEMIERVELNEEPLSEVASALGITPNNAAFAAPPREEWAERAAPAQPRHVRDPRMSRLRVQGARAQMKPPDA